MSNGNIRIKVGRIGLEQLRLAVLFTKSRPHKLKTRYTRKLKHKKTL